MGPWEIAAVGLLCLWVGFALGMAFVAWMLAKAEEEPGDSPSERAWRAWHEQPPDDPQSGEMTRQAVTYHYCQQ